MVRARGRCSDLFASLFAFSDPGALCKVLRALLRKFATGLSDILAFMQFRGLDPKW
jgi:hypothetical protein